MIHTELPKRTDERDLRWLSAQAQKLLAGREIIVVSLYGAADDHRDPEVQGPFRVRHVTVWASSPNRFSISSSYGVHCDNTPLWFDDRGFALHTLVQGGHRPIHRIYKVMVPTRDNPDGTTREQRDQFHIDWRNAAALDYDRSEPYEVEITRPEGESVSREKILV